MAATIAVLPVGSNGGDTSTMSAPMKCETAQRANEALGFQRTQTAGFGSTGPRSKGRIERIDVEGQVSRRIADHGAGNSADLGPSQVLELFDQHDADALLARPVEIVRSVEGAPDADLDGPGRINQSFFDGAPEWRAMGVAESTEGNVIGVRMRIDMDEA